MVSPIQLELSRELSTPSRANGLLTKLRNIIPNCSSPLNNGTKSRTKASFEGMVRVQPAHMPHCDVNKSMTRLTERILLTGWVKDSSPALLFLCHLAP